MAEKRLGKFKSGSFVGAILSLERVMRVQDWSVWREVVGGGSLSARHCNNVRECLLCGLKARLAES